MVYALGDSKVKREVSRDRRIPAFRIALADLGVLFERLEPLFSGGEFSPTITVSLKNEELKFESIDELSTFKGLPVQITSFKIWIYGGKGNSLSLKCGGFLGSPASVSAFADNEAWCAGAIEVVWQFFQTYRVWYGPFRGWPLNVTTLVSFNFPLILSAVGVRQGSQVPLFLSAWAVASLTLGVLYIGKNRLLPSAVLQIAHEENILRRYMPELTLLVAVISLILSIAGLFMGKNL